VSSMVPIIAASAAAGSAAARQRRLRSAEKKYLQRLRQRAGESYEFKILRSAMGAFANPQTVQRVIGEEARAGWRPVKKLDSRRLCFGRHIRERALDESRRNTGIDPYRKTYGLSENELSLVIVGAMFAGMLVAGIVFCVMVAA
jgi:hypothetical protein